MHTGACVALYMQSNMWCNRTGVIIHGGPCSHGGPCIYIYGYTMNLDISISLSICVCVYLCTHIYCIFNPAMISCHWQSLFKTADVFDEACLLSAASQGKTLSYFFFLLKWFHPHAASATFFFWVLLNSQILSQEAWFWLKLREAVGCQCAVTPE